MKEEATLTASLSGHGVHHQENFRRRYGSLDIFQFLHQSLVDVKAAGGVKDNIVVAVVLSVGNRFFCDFYRIALSHLEYRTPAFSPITCSWAMAAGR